MYFEYIYLASSKDRNFNSNNLAKSKNLNNVMSSTRQHEEPGNLTLPVIARVMWESSGPAFVGTRVISLQSFFLAVVQIVDIISPL